MTGVIKGHLDPLKAPRKTWTPHKPARAVLETELVARLLRPQQNDRAAKISTSRNAFQRWDLHVHSL